jgi:hypothetical protein
LPYKFELDFGVYFVVDLNGQNISDYTRLDARLGWRPMEKLEISLVGQNLQDLNTLSFCLELQITFLKQLKFRGAFLENLLSSPKK